MITKISRDSSFGREKEKKSRFIGVISLNNQLLTNYQRKNPKFSKNNNKIYITPKVPWFGRPNNWRFEFISSQLRGKSLSKGDLSINNWLLTEY